MSDVKPMKAPSESVTEAELPSLPYPMMASPKVDGVRALWTDDGLRSRTMRPFRNEALMLTSRELAPMLDGLDGELVVGPETGPRVLRDTYSGVMSREGAPNWRFLAFDRWDVLSEEFYVRHRAVLQLHERMRQGGRAARRPEMLRHFHVLPHVMCRSADDVLRLEAEWLRAGYEGLMLRTVDGPYKYGRVTRKQGWMLKMKRFEDGEMLVKALEAALANDNEAETLPDGSRRRGRAAAGRSRETDLLGVVVGTDVKTGETVRATAARMTHDERREALRDPSRYLGNVGTYRRFPGGTDAARFPVWHGLRSADDMDGGNDA